MKGTFRAALCCSLLMALVVVAGSAQPYQFPPTPAERPEFFTTVQDSILVCLVDDHDTLAPNLVSGAYTFIMPYDSICTISYLFTEPWHNGERLDLEHWIREQSVNAPEDLLSFNSRTENFMVRTGDTVSFYRQIDWKNPTGPRDINGYFSRDTLGYVVELVESSTMRRLAMIDSICLLPQMPPGKYRFYGYRNARAVAKYVVPSSMNGDSVCMRIRLYARGSGEYYFTRYDNIVMNYSIGGLRHPVRIADLEFLRQCCWNQISLPEQFGKSIAAENPSGPSMLSVRQPAAGGADVTIEIRPAPKLGELSIIIFDTQGNALASPFSGVVSEARVIPYTFPSSGAYVVCLVRDGSILESQKVIITT